MESIHASSLKMKKMLDEMYFDLKGIEKLQNRTNTPENFLTYCHEYDEL